MKCQGFPLHPFRSHGSPFLTSLSCRQFCTMRAVSHRFIHALLSPEKSPLSPWMFLACMHQTAPCLSELSEAPSSPSDRASEERDIPDAERCKSLLTANWRAQLTTVNAAEAFPNPGDSTATTSGRVHGSLVPYTVIDASPIVALSPEDAHQVNLAFDDGASLVVGNTDPPFVARSLVRHGASLPRAILLGRLLALEPSEAAYVRKRFAAQAAAAAAADRRVQAALQRVLRRQEASWGEGAVEGSGAADEAADLRSETGSGLATARQATPASDSSAAAHPTAPPTESLPPHPAATTAPPTPPSAANTVSLPADASFFRMAATACFRVDPRGTRCPVPLLPLRAAAADPLAPLALPLLQHLNAAPRLRTAMAIVAAAYLHCSAAPETTLLTAADRLGMSLMTLDSEASAAAGLARDTSSSGENAGGMLSSGGGGKRRWRELRVGFHGEVTSAEGFIAMLLRMEGEVLQAVTGEEGGLE